MKEIVLFEIPIYSLTNEVSESFDCAELINRPCLNNQIVGFIAISYWDNSIWFHKYSKSENRENCMNYGGLSGFHFHLKDDMTNSIIKDNIMSWINTIKKDIIKEPWYFETVVFEKQLKYTDIKEMIDSNK